MSLGQDDVVEVKIAVRAASASECLSSCRISSNRLAEEEKNKSRSNAIRRASSNDGEKVETSGGKSGCRIGGFCGKSSGGSWWASAGILVDFELPTNRETIWISPSPGDRD